MGVSTPDSFVEEYYRPSIGDEVTVKYERNLGVASSGVGQTRGKVKKVYEQDGEFCGFRISVDESDNIPDDEEQTPSLDVYSRFGPKGDINIYLEWPSDESRRKLNAVPGVELVEVNEYS